MSMFYELMMRKKEEIMYATIKGSLTENDGVFSGFSSSNYLLGQTIITSEIQQQYIQSSEFKFKITLPNTIPNEEHILYFPYKGIFNGFTLRTNGKIRWYVISSDISISSSSAFTLSSTIFIKGVISNNVATLYSSSDGVSWNNEGSVAITEIAPTVSNGQIKIGVGGSSPFGGLIDLNNSYIKLGSTKYNLQSVYGYKIVGTLTENPSGVFSGFSGSNYIDIPYPFPFLSSNNWKIIIKATTTYNGNQQRLMNGSMIRGIGNPMRWCFYVSSNNDNWLSDILLEDYPYFKIERKENTIYMSASVDGITWSNPQTTDLTNLNDSSYIRFGQSSSTMWTGLLYIKDCLIYNQNKLWFNGREG